MLVLGETGTGKELVARGAARPEPARRHAICGHQLRALPEHLIESELFGHRKGAFTGAEEHRIGLFEVAHGGTLFLDEIGELPKSMQAKLLRVLESGEIRRVGDNQATTVDVRIVSATHRRLDEMVDAGEFREDLMFRVNTFEIGLPSLRQRIDDVPQLATHLLQRFIPNAGAAENLFTPEALELLKGHHWPGNVRELANVIEHASILCDRPPIGVEHLPQKLDAARQGGTQARPRVHAFGPMTLRELEMQAIHGALERNAGNKPKTAEELGISLKTLYNKLNQEHQWERSA